MGDRGGGRRALIGRLRARRSPAPGALAARLVLLNPETLARATAHPVILHRHLTALGLPVPRLHGVVGPAGGWSADGARPVIGPAQAARFLEALAGDLRLQPHGGPARIVRHDADGDRRALVDEIFAPGAPDLVVVQEWRGRGASARLVTAVGDDGVARIAHRWAAADPGVDALALRAAAALMPQRALAVEIAAGPDGPLVLSVASRWADAPGLDPGAALAALESALAEGEAA